MQHMRLVTSERRRDPESCPALVLNADFQPLSYFPLSLWSWQDALKAAFLERIQIVNEYDVYVHSPSRAWCLPSVIALKSYVKPPSHPLFTRFNLFLRDGFTCQYCGQQGTTSELTFDHVIPRRAGGRTIWENVVAACAPCNAQKGGRLPSASGMKLRKTPTCPDAWMLHQGGRRFPPNYMHESWRDYLYWDSELEP